MTSESSPGGRSPRTFSFEAGIEDKTMRCDRRKVCLAKVEVLRKKHPGELDSHEVKKIAKKEMTMTIDDDKRASAKFSYTSLRYFPGISRISPNIEEYVQSLLEDMGPVPLGGGLNRRTYRMCLVNIIENNSKNQKQSFL